MKSAFRLVQLAAPALAAAALGLGAARPAAAQQIEFLSVDPGIEVSVEVAATVAPGKLRAGEFGRIKVEVEISPPWYIYALTSDPDNGPPTKILLETDALWVLPDRYESMPIIEMHVPTRTVYRYHKARGVFWVDVQARGRTPIGPLEIAGEVVYAACNGKICLPERRVPFIVQLAVERGAVRDAYKLRLPQPFGE